MLDHCKEVLARIQAREQFYTSLRGSARIEARGETIDLDLAMMRPYFLRAEVSGPLGIRVGLVQVNSEWAQFYEARNRRVRRLPFEEFQKNSLRRERFLAALPVPFLGPNFVDYSLSRTGLPSDESGEKLLRSCDYKGSSNVYEVLFVEEALLEKQNRWHLVEIDPTNFFPIRHRSLLMPLNAVLSADELSWDAPEWDLKYSNFLGEGFSTLPRRLQVYQRKELLWAYEWLEAERIQDRGEEIFQWRPTASMSVNDY